MHNFEQTNYPDKSRDEVQASIERTGMQEKLDPEIYDILRTIEQMSNFNEDARLVSLGTENVLAYLNEAYPQEKAYHLSEQQKTENRLAALLHDIGKAGPADASSQEREAIVRLFASENIKSAKCSVHSAIATSFATEEAKEIAYYLERCGVRQDSNMRQFWDMHAFWTKDILEKHSGGLSERTRVLAASHHFDQGINPYGIGTDSVDDAARAIGQLEEYKDIVGRQIISSIDKYEANVRRSGASHEKAIAWLKNNQHKPDENLERILAAIDTLGREGRLFGAPSKVA